MLADSEVQVTSVLAIGLIVTGTLEYEIGLRRWRQVGRATEKPWDQRARSFRT